MLGDKIRQHRKRNHISQEELAEKLGVSRQSISLWENNQTQPTIDNIVSLSKLLGVSTDELLSESNSKSDLHRPESEIETNPIVVPVTSTVTTTSATDALPQQDKVVAEAPNQIAQKRSKRAIVISATVSIAFLVLILLTACLITRNDNQGSNTQLSAEDIELFPEVKQEVKWISDWRFQYYANQDTYVLLFQLADKDKIPVSASGTVEIRIVNDNNVTVYSKTHTFTAANFEEWIYDDTKEMYLATIYISPQSINKGSTEYGTAYFEVYGDGYSFEECTASVFGLPTSPDSAPNNPQQGGTTPDSPQQGGTSNKYTCLSLNCNNAVVKSGDYCSEHKCQNGNCGYERESNAKYCSVCLCGTSGCLNVKTKNGYYCAEHTCSETKCQYNKAANEKYCSYHACDICGELRASGSLYCAQHQSSSGNDGSQQGSTTPPATQPTQYTCLKSTCKNVVSKSGEYCSEHKCANSNCSFQKDYNSDYCGSCTCNTASCKKPHIENGYHCTEHTCKASECTTEKQYSSDYCITHKCNSCNNQKIDNGSYCVDHTCAKNDCNWDKQYGSEYCFKHTCMAGTCKKETLGDGDYCEEHTCIVPGCDKQKLLDDYCYYHTP